MLLKIQEPGEIRKPHKKGEVAIGIDLGTTNSVVAFSKDHNATILKNGKDDSGIIPSAVAYCHDHIVVGHEAVNMDGCHVITSVKRLMGKGVEYLQHLLENKIFDFISNQNVQGILKFQVGERVLTPIDTSADILKFLKERAEFILEKSISKAVITVPAYFSENARLATLNAAKIAGLDPLRLLSEPTAAAVAYGLDGYNDGIYAVYDLGGGTFDFSLLRFEKGVFQVLATGGDTHLGGDDLDYLLVKEILKCFNKSIELIEGQNLKSFLKFARLVKEDLSHKKYGSWPFEYEGVFQEFTFSIENLNKLFQPILNKTIKIVENVLRDANITASNIDQIILVGGSTKSPVVQKVVQDFFKKPPLCSLNPEEVVAMGAAIQAEALTHGAEHLLLDVTPLSLGVETMGGIVEKIIPRNTPIPASITQEFTTHQDNQNAISIHVVQGEGERIEEARSLGRFVLKDLPLMPAGLARVAITYTLDVDGLLSVTATEKTTGLSQHTEIKPSYGLDFEEIEKLLKFNKAQN